VSKAPSSNEIEAGIAGESWHTIQKRETFDAPSVSREMLLEGLEALEPVPNPCGVLEVEAGHGIF